MSREIYIGIDNGVTGSVGIIVHCDRDGISNSFFGTPSFVEQSYVKAKKNRSRIDTRKLRANIRKVYDYKDESHSIYCLLERPMINGMRFQASISAACAMEAMMITLERLKVPIVWIDSKEWQKVLLPSGIKGGPDLKRVSAKVGCKLFPKLKKPILEQEDADGLLIAEYCRRFYR